MAQILNFARAFPPANEEEGVTHIHSRNANRQVSTGVRWAQMARVLGETLQSSSQHKLTNHHGDTASPKTHVPMESMLAHSLLYTSRSKTSLRQTFHNEEMPLRGPQKSLGPSNYFFFWDFFQIHHLGTAKSLKKSNFAKFFQGGVIEKHPCFLLILCNILKLRSHLFSRDTRGTETGPQGTTIKSNTCNSFYRRIPNLHHLPE